MLKHFMLTILIGVGCFVALAALDSHAADLKANYQPAVDAFFQKIQEGKIQEAVSDFFADNPWVERNPDLVAGLRSRLVGLHKQVGKYYGNQFLDEKAVAGRFVHVSYLAFYERNPVMFGFQFYMPQDTWRAHAIMHSIVASELKEARRLENILKDQ